MWNVTYPFQLIVTDNESSQVTHYPTFGEAIAQQIEWEARQVPGISIELNCLSTPIELETV